MVIEVGEDVNIAVGNEENAAVLHELLEKAKPITELVSIVSLSDLGDPGNLFYIADKAGQLYDAAKEGYVYLIKDESGKIIVSTEAPEGVKVPKSGEDKATGLPEGNYKIDDEEISVPASSEVPADKEDEGGATIKDIEAVIEIAEFLAELEKNPGPTIQPDSTIIQTGEINTLNVDIPEEFTGPFDIEYIDVGGSGAGVVLPSTSDSYNLTGEFISSTPGVFGVEIRVIDAEGRVYTSKTTIWVEGEVAEEIIDGEAINLSGTISVSNDTFPRPGVDPRTHKLEGSGTISFSIIGDQVIGSCNLLARDYWRCPSFADSCINGGEYPPGSWIISHGDSIIISGSISGIYSSSTGRIEMQVGEHSLTGTLVGNEASGKFYYELPNGQPAFYWSAEVVD